MVSVLYIAIPEDALSEGDQKEQNPDTRVSREYLFVLLQCSVFVYKGSNYYVGQLAKFPVCN